MADRALVRKNTLAYFVQASRTKENVIKDCDKVSTLSAIFSSPQNSPTFVYLADFLQPGASVMQLFMAIMYKCAK